MNLCHLHYCLHPKYLIFSFVTVFKQYQYLQILKIHMSVSLTIEKIKLFNCISHKMSLLIKIIIPDASLKNIQKTINSAEAFSSWRSFAPRTTKKIFRQKIYTFATLFDNILRCDFFPQNLKISFLKTVSRYTPYKKR